MNRIHEHTVLIPDVVITVSENGAGAGTTDGECGHVDGLDEDVHKEDGGGEEVAGEEVAGEEVAGEEVAGEEVAGAGDDEVESGDSGDGQGATPQCRFCLEEETPLIRPCKCSGTQAHVHPHCLQRWVELAPTSAARTSCQMCHHSFNVVSVSRRRTTHAIRLRRFCAHPLGTVLPLQFVAFWLGYCINLINCKVAGGGVWSTANCEAVVTNWQPNYAVGSTVAVVFASVVTLATYVRMRRPRGRLAHYVCVRHREGLVVWFSCVVLSFALDFAFLYLFSVYVLAATLLTAACSMRRRAPPADGSAEVTHMTTRMTFGEYLPMDDDE
jgi:hypothetical protein